MKLSADCSKDSPEKSSEATHSCVFGEIDCEDISSISLGLRKTLQEEIKKILYDVEEQLKEFVALIDEVQSKTPDEWEVLTPSPLPSSLISNAAEKPLRQLQKMESSLRHAPLKDAFRIVRNLLGKISILVNRVSESLKSEEEEYLSAQSPNFNLYYSQYVFQIALYVLRIVGKHLMHFCLALEAFSEPHNDFLEDGTIDEPGKSSVLHHKQHKFCNSSSPQVNVSEQTVDMDMAKSLTEALKVLTGGGADNQTENKSKATKSVQVPLSSILRRPIEMKDLETIQPQQLTQWNGLRPQVDKGVNFHDYSHPRSKPRRQRSLVLKGCRGMDTEAFFAAVERLVVETYKGALQSRESARQYTTSLIKMPAEEKGKGQIRLSNYSEGMSLVDLFPPDPENGQRGHLPSGVMEVREVRPSGDLNVHLAPWEPDCTPGHELVSSIMHVASRDPHEPPPTPPPRHSTRLRHSVGVINLDLVRLARQSEDSANCFEPVKFGFSALEMPKKGLRGRWHKRRVARRDRVILAKLWALYDDLAARLYCTGPPLLLKLRKNCFVDDALKTLLAPSRIPLSHYLSIRVLSHGLEEGQEAEEELEEFLPRLASKLFSPLHLQLFEHQSEESSSLYPNPISPALPEWFQLCGVVLALSLLHQRPLHVRLPLCFFKCLFDRPMSLGDLKELDPLLLRRMEFLRERDLRREGPCGWFTVRERVGQLFYSAELVEGGAARAITEDNKHEYIALCARWKLAERCLLQMQEIRKGFLSVLDTKVMDRFTEAEIQGMVEMAVEYSSDEEEERKSCRSI